MPVDPSLTASRRWRVTLYEGGFVVDAETELEARAEAFCAIAESLDLFVVKELPAEESLPTVEEVQAIFREARREK